MIPSMGGTAIGDFLRNAAARVMAPSCIVEVGPWLGAGTAHLAMGASDRDDAPEIHTYDMFQARGDEVVKASARDTALQLGQDTLPLVRSILEPFGGNIAYHKGDILAARWPGAPIGLYVDDAAKTPTLFYHALQTFAPSWIPGETIVVLMDYRFWERQKNNRARRRLRVQQNFVERHPTSFEEIHDPSFAGSIAAFRYIAPFPMGRVNAQAKVRRALRKLSGG